LAVLKGDGSSLLACPVSFAIIPQQGGRLVGWLACFVGWLVRGRKKGGEAHGGVYFVCLLGLEKV
jgi:hypothetical protein